MKGSLTYKTLITLMKVITHPRSSLSWVRRGQLAKDRLYVRQTYWFTGTLPRVSLNSILPGVEEAEVLLPRAFDRKSSASISASITVEEACHLGAIAKCIQASRALEIGTYDGNTALVLAANLPAEGNVVTVDLPPDFGMHKQGSLIFPGVELNLTPRDQLGRQYQGHRLSARIRQVYGDSAKLDWSTFGGPFDMIFIDGCHSEAYVRSDSQNALNHLAPGGVIVWHDYCAIPEVSKVVDQFALQITWIKAYALEGTRLAVGLT
jgi:predicted O-methyltransferase YrrM